MTPFYNINLLFQFFLILNFPGCYITWVARATTERGEYELDEKADDPEDPPRPNTFLARVVEAAEEEEGEHEDVGGGRQPHSSQFWAEEGDEVDLLGDLQMECAMPSTGGANLDDDVDFERLMLGLAAYSQSMREAPAIVSHNQEERDHIRNLLLHPKL
ncbi:hypothetical protein Taro_041423 [Colocasia esculenta]|uniref:Uncharacterized protein n=1 Tax=Colocasia esculenta TaxID=4460 RepID=A0A843WX91_COLES|nr:hypothetical protein [Colocasia esculenta]